MNLNKVMLMGRLVRDPELKEIPSQTGRYELAKFTIAVNGNGKNREVDYVDIVVWGKQSAFVMTYFEKGMLIYVEGKLRINSYKDKNGVSKISVSVEANILDFGESKRSSEENKKAYYNDTYNNYNRKEEPQEEYRGYTSTQEKDKDDSPTYNYAIPDRFYPVDSDEELPF